MSVYRFKFKGILLTLDRKVWSLQVRDVRTKQWLEVAEIDCLNENQLRETVKVLNQISKLDEEQQAVIEMVTR